MRASLPSAPQACGTCHNDQLDQTISRARFNIALGRLDRSELDVALGRLTAPRGSPGSMPPPGRRQIDRDALQPLIAYLKSGERSADDDALLERASELGMAPKQRYRDVTRRRAMGRARRTSE